MGNVIEEHQPRADRIFEVEDVEASWSLIQPVPVAARVKTEQATENESKCCFV